MKRATCVGECMIELTHVDACTLRLGFAGDTYNTAVYLRRAASALQLELEVGYLTGLGADEYSAAMRAAWRAEAIVDRSLRVEGRLPGLYAVRTAENGERRFSYWRDQSAARHVFAGTGWRDRLDGDVVHFSGISLQLMSAPARAALLARLAELRAGGAQVSFDTNYRPSGWTSGADAAAAIGDACAVADIVLASRDDERLLHGERAPEESLRRLADLGAGEAILRDGPAGAYVLSADGLTRVPAQPVERVVDTTAAGDAFAGGYLAARLAGAQPESAAALGNAVAGAVIGHAGAICPPEARIVPRAWLAQVRQSPTSPPDG